MALTSTGSSAELASAVRSYVQTNIACFTERQETPYDIGNPEHFVVYVVNKAEEISGFHYFYFEATVGICTLFATYVDAEYRRKGAAANLMERAFEYAAKRGCREFVIPFSEPTPPRDGLFNWSCRHAGSKSPDFKFEIRYRNEIFRF